MQKKKKLFVYIGVTFLVSLFGWTSSANAQATGTGSLPTNENFPTFYIDKPNSLLKSSDECLISSNDRGDMWCNQGLNFQTATRWDKAYNLDRIAVQMCWNTQPNELTRQFWEQGHATMNGFDSYNRIVFNLIDNDIETPAFNNQFGSYNNVYAEILNPHALPVCNGELEFTSSATVIYKLNTPLTVFDYQTLYTRFTSTYYSNYVLPYGETVFSGAAQKGYLTNDFGVYSNAWQSPKFVLNPLAVAPTSEKSQKSYGYCSGTGCTDQLIISSMDSRDKFGAQYQMINNDIGGLRYFQYLNFIGENANYNFESYLVGAVGTTTPNEYPTVETFECGITSGDLILGCIKNAFNWAFVPPKESFQPYYELMDKLKRKPPMGYFTAYAGIFDFSTTTSPTSTLFVLVSDDSVFMNYIFTPLRSILVIVLFVFASVWFFKRVKNIKI